MLHVASVCTPCCMLLDVVAQSLKPVKLFSQQLPTFLLFRDRRSVAQQCWIRLHSSSNIVGATHTHYAWITKTYGLYSSHDALQVPNLLGVVASVCTPLQTRTQQLPTLFAQQCLELLLPFCTQPKYNYKVISGNNGKICNLNKWIIYHTPSIPSLAQPFIARGALSCHQVRQDVRVTFPPRESC